MGQRSDVSKDIQPPAQSMAKERGWWWGGLQAEGTACAKDWRRGTPSTSCGAEALMLAVASGLLREGTIGRTNGAR